MIERASSSSSLGSYQTFYDHRFDHLYSYSSNLDLFQHQLLKQQQRKDQSPSNNNIQANEFDLLAETRKLMDRTDQLVGSGNKQSKEWVI